MKKTPKRINLDQARLAIKSLSPKELQTVSGGAGKADLVNSITG